MIGRMRVPKRCPCSLESRETVNVLPLRAKEILQM